MDPKAQTTRAQVLERLQQATNVLVTVSADPSVDQLAAAIGLTLMLNKLGKHATAVFIVAHGRILHDATVISINNNAKGEIGNLNWNDAQASSLCEMLVALGESLQPNLLDGQMATAFLTGIVAQTDRFSNDKTSPEAMN